MELYEFLHLETGKKFCVFMDKAKAEAQLADLNRDAEKWQMRPFFEAIFDNENDSPRGARPFKTQGE